MDDSPSMNVTTMNNGTDAGAREAGTRGRRESIVATSLGFHGGTSGLHIVLPAAILGLHLYSVWAFGATFWYDSANYLQLGFALGSRHDLNEFYRGSNYYIFQHLMAGYPLLLATTAQFCGRYGWPVLAAIQHVFSICALLYFLKSYQHWLSPRWWLFTGILICVHPYYMTFHDAPMTESLAGSLLLFAVGAALRILDGGRVSKNNRMVLAGSGALAVQIRSPAGMIVFGMLIILIFAASDWGTRLRTGCAALIVAASLLLFPVYRWAVTGTFFLPNIDYLTLAIALGINPHPTDDVVRKLKEFPLPKDLSAETISARGLTYEDAAHLGTHLRSLGYSDDAARSIVRRMAWIVRTDSYSVMLNQARLALLSIGSPNLALAGGGAREFYRGYPPAQFRAHVRYYLDWFSWTMFENYERIFDQFLDMFGRSPETIDERVRQSLGNFLRPFFVTRHTIIRDPLKLSRIPFEVWIVGWLLAVLSRSGKNARVAVLLVTPVVLNYIASVSAALGDLRYSQSLLPLYMAGSITFIAQCAAWGRSQILALHAERADT
jgi:hypothetical protein